MTVENTRLLVIKELHENSVAINELIEAPFELHEVFDVVTEVIELAEALSPDGMSGKDKKAVVTGVIEWLDKKFNITATIVVAILPKLPRWLRWLLPVKRIKKIIVKIFPAMIDVIVRILNKYVWKKKSDGLTAAPDVE